jgi:cytochrome b subunit of formate dehydrogenase
MWKFALIGLLGLALACAPRANAAPIIAKPAEAAAAPAAAAPAAGAPATVKPRSLPPREGSHLAPDKNNCIVCHGEPERWDEKDPKSWRLYVPRNLLAQDVHWVKGVNCHDCHGGNPAAEEIKDAPHAKEDGFRALPEVKKLCGQCHPNEALELFKGVHARAGERNERGGSTPLDCARCHGKVAHQLLPVKDSRSPVFAEHQVETCGACHEKDLQSYILTVHGHGLFQEGLQVTAVCANCHGAHGIYRAADNRSTLFPANVGATCGKCHQYILERLAKSVHGRGTGPGGLADRVAPGGKTRQRPCCTSCHQNHDISNPESARFRLEMPNLCGNCHVKLSGRYALSMHGELTELGYAPGAKCSDCHGNHDILPVDDPASRLSPQNRLETCRRCHPNAVRNVLQFDPHADPRDPRGNRLLHGVYLGLTYMLLAIFGSFGIHSVFWFVRGLIDVLRHGRPRGLVAGGVGYVRFAPFYRRVHALLLVSFLGLVATGLPLKFSQYEWARILASVLGGFESTSFWHRACALLTFGCFITMLTVMWGNFRAGRRRGQSVKSLVFGPDSPVPSLRDAKDLLKMLKWFVGLGPRPTFERWSYWEKFDFWGACSDVVLIGSTGLVLWFPNLFCLLFPGSAVNIAHVIHSTLALLATGFVFAIHFFSTHLRAEKFPADMSIFSGMTSEEELEEERPEYLQRMRQEGKLEELRVTVPSRGRLWTLRLLGLLALGAGIALLLGMIVASVGG